MLIAIVLDKPLAEAQALVDDPDAFMLEITKIIGAATRKRWRSFADTCR